MTVLRDTDAEPPLPHQAGRASWYIPGWPDGFGDRLLMFDNTETPSLELLRFHPELTATPGFEDVLRDRVRQLQRFTHPAFLPVRAVQHLEGGEGLALVSDHAPGQRLSELFRQTPRKTLTPSVVAWMLRELTPALAALQSHGPEVAHGALTPDRVVLTPEGRLRIVEHVLGSALQHVGLAPEHLWRDFGLVAPGQSDEWARLDAQSDVVQLAGVALSMLLGRPFTLDDLRHRLPALLDEISELSAVSHQTPPLRLWFERALQLGPGGYRAASEAHADLKALLPAPRSTTLAPGAPATSDPRPAPAARALDRVDARTAPPADYSRPRPAPRPARSVQPPSMRPAAVADVTLDAFPSESVARPVRPVRQPPPPAARPEPPPRAEEARRPAPDVFPRERPVREAVVHDPVIREPVVPQPQRELFASTAGTARPARTVSVKVVYALGAMAIVEAIVIAVLALRM